ncbi:hypothetical protein [Glutamicibacter endophyticus]|uniref:hypothetical protein n=1 Tax=Glutamicibacter endophyticus TaxID=1522174 RepID=UPI003AF19785
MDRNEKKKMREHISEHIDVSNARLTDDEARFLNDFVDGYDEYRGKSETRTSSYTGWSSDGKYTRVETTTDTFTDEVGIRINNSYKDDDGQSGESSTEVKDARGILNWFKDRR